MRLTIKSSVYTKSRHNVKPDWRKDKKGFHTSRLLTFYEDKFCLESENTIFCLCALTALHCL